MDFSRWSEAHHQQQQAQSTTASEAYAQFYNAHQHPYAHFPYYSHHQNPSAGQSNSSKNPSAAQFESASSDAGLRPPGIDAYAPNPYLPHGGYDVQSAPLPYGHGQMMQAGAAAAAYFQDPSVHQSYAIQQAGADHVAYAAEGCLLQRMGSKLVENEETSEFNEKIKDYVTKRVKDGIRGRG